MIVAKAALLDRENSQEVEKFNKLIEDYYNLLFIIGKADLNKKDSNDVESLMDGFRKQFRNTDFKVKPSQGASLKGKEFSTDITKLGELVKRKKVKK
jgi:hypothetical protein